jgi:DMSO/TMAO reductase YedYZ molybdopterin-dependent catalytic subunit
MIGNVFERKIKEEEIKRQGRMPPGQSLTRIFPVLHYGPVPRIDLEKWDFRVWGEVAEERHWTWQEFNELPRTRIEMDIHCVTRWSMFDTVWEGVSIKMLIEKGIIQIKPSAKYVIQHAEYGFTANLPLEVVLADTFLLATHYNGQPLTVEHGYPLRGVVGYIPGRMELKGVYFWKGAKWLRGLEFTPEDHPGFWEQAGYHNEADIWKEERVQEFDSSRFTW